MDQNPLPRGSSQVRDRPGQTLGAVLELTKTTIAVEAEYPAHPPGAMIVVQMLRVRGPADRAHAALLGEELVELLLPDPVPPPQVVLTATAVQAQAGFLALLVVARLAVSAVAAPARPVTREVVEPFGLTARGTAAVTVRHRRQFTDLPAVLLPQPLGITGLRTTIEAGLAVTATAVGPTTVGAELVERLPLVTVTTAAEAVPIIERSGHVRFARLCPIGPLFARSP